MSTKDAIVSILRKESLTASELAQRLGVTRNAVIVPLRQLEAEGIVLGAERKAKRVGKPALEYRVSPGQEDRRSQAYPAFVEVLVEAAGDKLSAIQVEDLMKTAGRKMASAVHFDPTWNADERLTAARAFLDGLGAETLLEPGEGASILRSFSCPLGRAVRKQPCVCSVVEAFLEEAVGVPVQQTCTREDRLRCEFHIGAETG